MLTCFQKSQLGWLAGAAIGALAGAVVPFRRTTRTKRGAGVVLGALAGAAVVGAFWDVHLERTDLRCM